MRGCRSRTTLRNNTNQDEYEEDYKIKDRFCSMPMHHFSSNYRSLRIVSLLFLVTFIVQMPTALQKEVKWNNIT